MQPIRKVETMMNIANLDDEQNKTLAEFVLRTLAELWCDQNGIDAVIKIVPRKMTENGNT